MPVSHSQTHLPPRCDICGGDTARIGKLPRIGVRPLVHVYKCEPCNHIMSVEPDIAPAYSASVRNRPAVGEQPKNGRAKNT
jgi:hypothetical protein